ncbi:lachesin [Caerostris darwini]|uniref:Lachesin n=1 Tax=Caerostris darwini TaxID=1538125 RepID=A0AAV4WEJ3_9ARAC|nr:lachesin [Caerostris darwini]
MYVDKPNDRRPVTSIRGCGAFPKRRVQEESDHPLISNRSTISISSSHQSQSTVRSASQASSYVHKNSLNLLKLLVAAWIKVETKAILTIHQHIITRNYRISLSHSDNRNFVLQIRNVQAADKGGYMCQVNTVPMKSQVGYLDVLGE